MKNAIIFGAAHAARAVLFGLMLFLRPLVTGIASLLGGLSLIGFLGTLILARHQTTPLFAFLSVGVFSVAVGFVYNWILMMLAPAGFTMMMGDE